MDLRADILPYRDRLYRLALGITLHTAEAEDVVQDTMLRAWERREEWPQIQNIEAWLTQICRNLALDRKQKMSRITPLSTSAQGEPAATATTSKFEGEAMIALLARLMAQLPSPQDDIVRLRDIEGFSYREIAEKLNLSETQVRVYLHRGRQRLREQYTRIQNYGL